MNPFVQKLMAYGDLSQREIDILVAAAGDVRSYKAGQEIVGVDQRMDYSTAIVRGWSARFKVFPDGRRQITALHIAGDFVDLHSFLLHVMDQGVVALSSCEVITMPHANIQKISESEPHLTRLLWTSTLVDGALHREWLAAMGQLPTAAQAAHLFCELYLRLEAVQLVDESYTFEFPLTQAQLADALGVSEVHANRTIQELRADKLISWSAGMVSILSFDRLAKLGRFDPTYLHLSRESR